MASPRRALWVGFARNLSTTVGAGIVGYAAIVLLAVRLLHVAPTVVELLLAGDVLLVSYLFALTIGAAIQAHARVEGGPARTSAARIVANLLIAVVALFAVFAVFGTSPQNLFFGSAFVGIVLGLAGQTVLGNVFAGVTLVVANPFRLGDRIAIVSTNYGALAPSYPHELLYPEYTGSVVEMGLVYTELRLDSGRLARIPNSVVLQALVLNLSRAPLHLERIRVTLPLAVPVVELERALAKLLENSALPAAGAPSPHVEVADVSERAWDGVVRIWTTDPDADAVRDRVLRGILPLVRSGGPESPSGG